MKRKLPMGKVSIQLSLLLPKLLLSAYMVNALIHQPVARTCRRYVRSIDLDLLQVPTKKKCRFVSTDSPFSIQCIPHDDHYGQIQRQKGESLQWQSKYQQLMDASTLSLAPMMEYTDRHFRHLVRLISKRTLLYTEMVPANAVAAERQAQLTGCNSLLSPQLLRQEQEVNLSIFNRHQDDDYLNRFLAQSELEAKSGPSVLQLGGSDPQQLYEAATAVWELKQIQIQRGKNSENGPTAYGCDYTAINLNCGCPSPKVVGGKCSFGAALMEQPALVAECCRAIHEGSRGEVPVTVKCRIGTDSTSTSRTAAYDDAEFSQLDRFIQTVASGGVVTDFAVHARIAVLKKSFSPADNRKIPPLKYDVVHRLVQDHPELTFSLNGGIETIAQVRNQLAEAPGLKGVMIGRAFAADPWSFAMADELLYGCHSEATPRNRWEILKEYGKHADAEEEKWDPVKIRRFIVKAVQPLFSGEYNSKQYRIALDEIAGTPKRLKSQGKSMGGTTPVSELILHAATRYLGEEVLLRTPEESYERVLWEERKRHLVGEGRSRSVNEWQDTRSVDSIGIEVS
jgi:tRNA-dihydrouridine synthase A